MNTLDKAIATLGVPGSVAAVVLVIFLILQLVGEIIERFGKVAPLFLKLRKIITNRKKKQKEQADTMLAVRDLLTHVDGHYSSDNIQKRDSWMQWVNDRAEVYDRTIVDFQGTLDKLSQALDANTKMTQKMFVESSRDRIIDFASKVTNHPTCYVSREEFNRIFKVYREYEAFLDEHNMTNGEVEVNYELIKEAYKKYQEEHKFIEDLRK